MNRTFATIATVTALTFGGAAFAQDDMPGTGEGYDMLQTALMSDFERMGISMESTDDLTLGQISAIKGILDSESSQSEQKQQVEAIIANN